MGFAGLGGSIAVLFLIPLNKHFTRSSPPGMADHVLGKCSRRLVGEVK